MLTNDPVPLFAGYMPNCIEAVEAMLAAASIGAIWSSTSPDFGVTVSQLSLRKGLVKKFSPKVYCAIYLWIIQN